MGTVSRMQRLKEQMLCAAKAGDRVEAARLAALVRAATADVRAAMPAAGLMDRSGVGVEGEGSSEEAMRAQSRGIRWGRGRWKASTRRRMGRT